MWRLSIVNTGPRVFPPPPKVRKADDSSRCTTAAGKTCGKGPPGKGGLCMVRRVSQECPTCQAICCLDINPNPSWALHNVYSLWDVEHYIISKNNTSPFGSIPHLTSLLKRFVTWKQSPLPNSSNNIQQREEKNVNSSFPKRYCFNGALVYPK